MLNDNVEPNFTEKNEVDESEISALIEADKQDLIDMNKYFTKHFVPTYQRWLTLNDEAKYGLIEDFYRDVENPIHRIIHTYFANQTTGRIFDILEELIDTNMNFNKAFEMLKVNSMLDAVKMIGSLMEDKD